MRMDSDGLPGQGMPESEVGFCAHIETNSTGNELGNLTAFRTEARHLTGPPETSVMPYSHVQWIGKGVPSSVACVTSGHSGKQGSPQGREPHGRDVLWILQGRRASALRLPIDTALLKLADACLPLIDFRYQQ